MVFSSGVDEGRVGTGNGDEGAVFLLMKGGGKVTGDKSLVFLFGKLKGKKETRTLNRKSTLKPNKEGSL